MTLGGLRKNIDRLKSCLAKNVTIQGSGRSDKNCIVSYMDTKSLFLLSASQDEAVAKYNDESSKTKKQLEDILIVNREFAEMKDILYAENAKYGIDKILTNVAQLEQEKKILNDILKSISNAHGVDDLERLYEKKLEDDKLEKEKENYYSRTNANLSLFDTEELKKRVLAITKEITKLEERKNELNWSHKATLELHHQTAELLGLE